MRFRRRKTLRTLIKATSSANFILFFALRTKQNRSKDVSVTYFQNIANMKQMTSALKTYRTSASNKLVSQGNWFRKETGFAEKLVSQGNFFLVTLGKTFINILVVKQSTYKY